MKKELNLYFWLKASTHPCSPHCFRNCGIPVDANWCLRTERTLTRACLNHETHVHTIWIFSWLQPLHQSSVCVCVYMCISMATFQQNIWLLFTIYFVAVREKSSCVSQSLPYSYFWPKLNGTNFLRQGFTTESAGFMLQWHRTREPWSDITPKDPGCCVEERTKGCQLKMETERQSGDNSWPELMRTRATVPHSGDIFPVCLWKTESTMFSEQLKVGFTKR